MANEQEEGISLKVLVDTEKNRVIFAECDNDFVDILLSFLTNPMGTIVTLSRKHSLPIGIGCMNNLYTSVENIDNQHFRNKASRAMLLSPRNGAEFHCMNLRLKIVDEPRRFFLCSVECIISKFRRWSYYRDAICECGKDMCDEISPPGKAKPAGDEGVFVKATNKFIISGDLQVMVLCTTTSFSLLSKSGVMDGSTIEERTFNLGVKEVLRLLMCSFVSRRPLVETLLMDKPVPDQSNSNFVFGQRGRTDVKEEMKNQEQDIFVKLFVSKSKKMVCYAEAKIDFVNLLFSFLTIPLGHVVKHVNNDGSFKGCLNRFYKSVQDLDEQCFNSSDHKEILVSPRVAPGFSYEYSLLGIEEAAPPACYYCCYCRLKYLFSNNFSCPSCHRSPLQMTAMFSKSHYKDGKSRGGFLKGLNLFTVTDNLVIKPITAISVLSILNELKVPFSDIEERTVHVGKQEALRLLLSSFVSESALTNTFIK